MPPIQFGNRTPYNTRTQPYFTNPYRYRLSQIQQFFRHTATNYWNNLSLNLKQMTSFNEFLERLKIYC